MQAELIADTPLADVPHIEQYFGPWACEESAFRAQVELFNRLDLSAHIQAARPTTQQGNFAVTGSGIAIVEISGTMTKFGSSLSDAGSTIRTRRQIRNAASDNSVAATLLHIDSPGGSLAGTKELADDVAAANAAKPVHVFISDIGASAAFYAASQAGFVSANQPAFVGSIGTYMAVSDFSQLAENEGVKVHVIKTGDFKGAGIPGTEITDEMLAEWQRLINESNELFLKAVAKGRKLPIAKVRELADGRVHLASQAVSLGLIDGVGTLEQAIRRLERESKQRSTNMSQQTEGVLLTEVQPAQPQVITETVTVASPPTPAAATIDDIKQNCPGATSDFIVTQMEAGATTTQATSAWIVKQQEMLAAKDAELAEAKKPAIGNAEIGTGNAAGDFSGDAVQEFKRLVAEKEGGGMNRQAAVASVRRDNPSLYDQYMTEYVAQHPMPKPKR